MKLLNNVTLIIILIRALFCGFFIFALDRFIDLGTSPYLISLSAILGILTATKLSRTRLNLRGFIFFTLTSVLICYFLEVLLQVIPSFNSQIFLIYSLTQHLELIIAGFLCALVTTWLFWRYKHALSFEIITILSIFILLLAGHHQYRFNQLTFINSLAWQFNTSPLAMLIIIIALIILAILSYFIISTTPQVNTVKNANKLAGSGLLLVFALIFYTICYATYSYHVQIASSRIKNGVGESNKKGTAPLDFHSGLGTSSQPVALVRLDNDYSENPFSPALYFRESAISDFNGKEMVVGDHNLDNDVSFTTPKQTYSAPKDLKYEERVPVIQSIYLLTEQQNAFALDYPLNINILKVPENTKKFLAAYKVYSMAPAFQINSASVKNAKVGNSAWSNETKKYYLATTTDPRYKELATKITAQAKTPLEKVFTLVDYLNKHVIYTLTPNTTVEEGEDDVSTFTFGKMRGYCVHFAHAMTYLLRSIGIPSRIATGYAVDLSQAKDGHILVRMNDRHAWAEVYINKLGWIPFDLHPEHIESHATTPVDMELLEELMDLVGPDEEILPEDVVQTENSFKRDKFSSFLPNYEFIFCFLGLSLLVVVLYKGYLILCWHLPSTPERTLLRGYRALLIRFADLGFHRNYGETRLEFKNRISKVLQEKHLNCTELIDKKIYNKDYILNIAVIIQELKNDFSTFHKLPLKKRLFSLLNCSTIRRKGW